ncbi:acyl-CoA-binding domain-containing protein 5-like isoform X2 [Anneissia japonica]|uniref:acyl-CoA-binding domain-containing protein 5-like isoform X2 n=1 Tax=Anneissia japonica TaxID=1529436 RepID=UPI0014259C63|nr:acyl-CoA-binding domain-containing protein 5-like isoform X2 [Anneissia japonica]
MADSTDDREGSSQKYDLIRTKRVFELAVATVKNMPQNGPFKPSYAMMSTFYGLYKQATMGRCCVKKPSIFYPVERSKWEAWSSFGDLSKEEAMVQYTEEFVKALLANSQTATIDQFSKTLHEAPETDESTQFISAIMPFIEAISTRINGENTIGDNTSDNRDDNIGDVTGDGSGDIVSESTGEGNGDDISDGKSDSREDDLCITTGDERGDSKGHTEPQIVEIGDITSDSENDDFCDTFDQVEASDEEHNGVSLQTKDPLIATYRPTQRVLKQEVTSAECSSSTVVEGRCGRGRETKGSSNQQILLVLENIQRDMAEIISRITLLENLLKRNMEATLNGKGSTSYISNLTPKQMAVHAFLICVWPIVIRWFIKYIWCKNKD